MSDFTELRDDIAAIGKAVDGYSATAVTNLLEQSRQIDRMWQDNAELRDEINAVANRVESLTRAVMADPAEVAQAIVNDANRETLREVHDAGSPLYREERGRYLIECSCGWEYEGKTEQDAKIAYGQHADRFVA